MFTKMTHELDAPADVFGTADLDVSIEQIDDSELIAAGCAGTFGTFGSYSGTAGTFGTFGCYEVAV